MPLNSFHNFLSSPPPRIPSLLCVPAGMLRRVLRWLQSAVSSITQLLLHTTVYPRESPSTA